MTKPKPEVGNLFAEKGDVWRVEEAGGCDWLVTKNVVGIQWSEGIGGINWTGDGSEWSQALRIDNV